MKIALEDKTAWLFAVFSAFYRFIYRFKLDLGMELDKTARGTAPPGCVYADAGLPGYMWRVAYAAYRGGLEKWLGYLKDIESRYVYETWKKLVDWF